MMLSRHLSARARGPKQPREALATESMLQAWHAMDIRVACVIIYVKLIRESKTRAS